MTTRRWTDEEPGELAFSLEMGRPAGRTTAACPPPDLVLAAHDPEAPAELRDLVSAHLATCPWCQAIAEAGPAAEDAGLTPAEELRIRTRVLPAPARPSPATSVVARPAVARSTTPSRPAWFRYGLPAALAASVVAAVWIRPSPLPPAPDVPAAPVLAAGQPAGPAPALRLDAAPAPIAAFALTFRGGSATPVAEDVRLGLAAYARGDYAAAARHLDAAVRLGPQAEDTHLFLGISRLMLGDPAAALDALSTAGRTAGGERRARVNWYTAIAADRTGDRTRALAELATLCGGTSPHRDPACAALSQLLGAP